MLTQLPNAAEWLALSDLGMAAFIFGGLVFFFGVLFLEWSELAKSVKSIFKLFTNKKSAK